jgi:prepilin-type processing-associated H-X9-DG protein
MLEELEEFASACQGIPSNPIESGWQGNPIIKGNFFRDGAYVVGMAATLYNHVVPPQNPSCTNSGNVGSAISTLTSNHNGIVNVVYCDGHVSNVSENIDVATWREIGNRRDNTNNQ